jgi:hypothetical protein
MTLTATVSKKLAKKIELVVLSRSNPRTRLFRWLQVARIAVVEVMLHQRAGVLQTLSARRARCALRNSMRREPVKEVCVHLRLCIMLRE